ncbi:fimbria/pilus outer membrane usher protein [Roseomonas sp. 18066]|uniref:fimbria/pilus outer membrane usher protein n=1 Tax=Roseomonas sp. 18066 TaxID=2681412 RepID=UPI001357CA86|nr:fimbria/pilus outer membrane usher protein [Roseomonas sp. 18066]
MLAALAATLLTRPAPAAERSLLLDVVVNEESTNTIGTFADRDGVLSARAEDLRSLGIAVSPGIPARTMIPLDRLPGLRFRLDEANSRILFTAEDASRVPAELGAAARPGERAASESGYGALLNYDLNVTAARGRTLGAGYAEGRVFGPFGVFSTDMLAYSSAYAGQESVVRLGTSFTRDDEDRMRRYQAGDLISGGLSWTRPVRLGGFQVARNFGLRPDLVTFPVPVVTGSAAVPSTVDVLVNGVQQLSTSTGSGPFVVRQLPVITGAGEVAVRVRDALGRETTSTLPFYASTALLAPGLLTYSAELGWVRRNYGLVSDDYGPPVGIVSARYGLANALTLEGHAEGGAELAMAGAGAVLGVGSIGSVSLSGAASQARAEDGAALTGWQLGAGFERVTLGLSFGASVTWASPGYADVAALDGADYPRRILRASASVPVLGGSLSMAYAEVKRDGGLRRGLRQRADLLTLPDASIVTVSYTRSLSERTSFYATGFSDLAGNSGEGFLLGLSFALGNRTTGAASASLDQGRSYGALQAQQAAVANGDLGWRGYASEGGIPRYLGELEYRGAAGRVLGGVDRLGGETALRGEARGAISTLGGGVYFSNPVQNAFAVVETGQAGIGVVQENRPVGTTDARGRLLVPDLRAYEGNRLGIAPENLPPDASVGDTTRMVTPRERAGVVVRFPVTRSAAARVRLSDAGGRPLPLGSIATPEGGAPLPVGYDGEVFVTELQPRNRLSVTLPEGKTCRVEFDFAPTPGELPLIGPLPCR